MHRHALAHLYPREKQIRPRFDEFVRSCTLANDEGDADAHRTLGQILKLAQDEHDPSRLANSLLEIKGERGIKEMADKTIRKFCLPINKDLDADARLVQAKMKLDQLWIRVTELYRLRRELVERFRALRLISIGAQVTGRC